MDEKLSLYLEKAQRYCSLGEQCVHSVSKKMREWGVETNEAEYIIGELIVGGYLNEERYAKAFARGKFKMLKWGRKKIVYHLKMNNISPANIKIALQEIDEDMYDEVLGTLLLNKWNETKGNVFSRIITVSIKQKQRYQPGHGEILSAAACFNRSIPQSKLLKLF